MKKIWYSLIIFLCFSLFFSCATTRSKFNAKDTRTVLKENFNGDLFSWEIANHGHKGKIFEHNKDEAKSYLRLKGNGGAYLLDSTLENFRMEFDVRLEKSLEGDRAHAMINFKNYFNKRYTVILSPDQLVLASAKIKHHQLKVIKEVQTIHSRNKWYHFEVVCLNDNIKIFKNNKLAIDYTDKSKPIKEGNIWFESHDQYSFTNVRIFEIEGFEKISNKPEDKNIVKPKFKQTFSIVVSDFENLGAADHEAALIMDLFATSLAETNSFNVIERRELRKVLAEQELQLTGLSDSKSAVKIGNMLNAKYLSTGSIGKLGNNYIITVKIINIESGVTVATKRETLRNPDLIPERLNKLSMDIAVKMNSK